jgi:non-ribosomal peptide synthetase component F
VSRDPEAFHALVRREGVTVLNQTPSAFRQFIRVDGERGGELALRVVVFGGEALEPATLREWVERRGAETPRLVNMYGITETTVHVTYRPLTEADVAGGSGSPIGVRSPTCGCTCWTRGGGRCRSGCRASCTWAARGWRAGT